MIFSEEIIRKWQTPEKEAEMEKKKQPDEKRLMAVSTIGSTHGWAKAVDYYAEKELQKVSEKNNWEYVCREANDANEQAMQVEELIAQGVDCLIMLPMDIAWMLRYRSISRYSGLEMEIY